MNEPKIPEVTLQKMLSWAGKHRDEQSIGSVATPSYCPVAMYIRDVTGMRHMFHDSGFYNVSVNADEIRIVLVYCDSRPIHMIDQRSLSIEEVMIVSAVDGATYRQPQNVTAGEFRDVVAPMVLEMADKSGRY